MLKAWPEILYYNYSSKTYIIADYHIQITQLIYKDLQLIAYTVSKQIS